jgi:hypothetical protein
MHRRHDLQGQPATVPLEAYSPDDRKRLALAQFHSKAEPALLTKVRQYIAVLLGIH